MKVEWYNITITCFALIFLLMAACEDFTLAPLPIDHDNDALNPDNPDDGGDDGDDGGDDGDDGGDGDDNGITNPPVLELYLTSKAVSAKSDISDVTAVKVTVSALKIRKTTGDDSGWINIKLPKEMIDLMQIVDINHLISKSEITGGGYNGLRFYIPEVIIITEDGKENQAKIPSQEADLNIHFTIANNQKALMLLEIDIEASIKLTGGPHKIYQFNPAIELKSLKIKDTD